MIRKVGSQYKVMSESGKHMGTYSSRAGAAKRLKQIEYFKHHSREDGGPVNAGEEYLVNENGPETMASTGDVIGDGSPQTIISEQDDYVLPSEFEYVDSTPATSEAAAEEAAMTEPAPEGFKYVEEGPSTLTSIGRGFGAGLVGEENLTDLMAGGRDPNQPVYKSTRQAINAMYDPETGQLKSTFDFKAQKNFTKEQKKVQAAAQKRAKETNPGAYGLSEFAGSVAPYLTPAAGETLVAKMMGQAAKGAFLEGARSDADIGTAEWAMDAGLGGWAGAGGETFSSIIKAGGGKMTDAAKNWLLNNGARRAEAWARVQAVGAMQSKYHGKVLAEQALGNLPVFNKIAAAANKADRWVVKQLSRPGEKVKALTKGVPGAKVKSKTLRAVAGLGDMTAKAWGDIGGTMSTVQAFTIANIGVLNPFGAIAAADLARAATGAVKNQVAMRTIAKLRKNPDYIVNLVKNTKYEQPLRMAAGVSPDALKATTIYMSQDDDFQREVMNSIYGPGTYDKILNRGAPPKGFKYVD